jgi:hypothetical protein
MKNLPTAEQLSNLAVTLAAHGKKTTEAVEQALEIWEQCQQLLEFKKEVEDLEELAAQADAEDSVTLSEAMERTRYKTKNGLLGAVDSARIAYGYPARVDKPDVPHERSIHKKEIDLITACDRQKEKERKRSSRNRITPYQEKSSRDTRAIRTGQKPSRKK